MKSLSHVWLFATLWAVAYQSALSMGISRQEYWSGLPFPSLVSISRCFSGILLLLYDSGDVDNFVSCSSAFSKSNLNIWKFLVHILLKPSLENFEHYFASVCDECNCATVWTFFSLDFLWDCNESWPFPVLWPLLSFPNLLAYWVQHFHSIIF